ncbi:putative alkaline shock family protein YloU [Clostridium acetobutylicum]|uniref:LXG domain-containing protein n=1 Tax=Clostridium acetobutylicum (strain ATCC 824 / DSM 792 / JCM 1419 / IAM 19013 / LMG 5710 / NBRC 13948 / NRRL B-527 / VKM B-1787 / 2291 / W) TaxID=272562 RepID=Q97LY6_CLOAB|nr:MULTISPECIES: hypothetical protein [Clostridium]AAK78394.1 Hypothetical protein CA_C0414 [Clostridium acetobutylicum ATCC 824]ADZ19463.1 Conserved hypothetical protein [Clostridium acetobutylicum EA 2018]AEI31230.1 hypothetical protein SMB_G0422 [Clostridium acetobutylicum DSM 1731]AWV80117.1 hypothetical protein DK921_08425 [Clostridium acetobutylicum]MBC2392296.1 hypothetical protein [Clostridium acetobutylicum]
MDEIFLKSDELQNNIDYIKKLTNQMNDVQNEIKQCIKQLDSNEISKSIKNITDDMYKNYEYGQQIVEEIMKIESIMKNAVNIFNELDINLGSNMNKGSLNSAVAGILWEKQSSRIKTEMKKDFEEIDKSALKIKKDTFKRDLPEAFTRKLENFFDEPKIQATLTLVGGGTLITGGLLKRKALSNKINTNNGSEALKYKINNYNQIDAHAEETNLDQHELKLSSIGINLKKVRGLAKSGIKYYLNKDSVSSRAVNDTLDVKDNYVYANGSIKNGNSSGIREALNFSREYMNLARKGFGNGVSSIMKSVGDADISNDAMTFFPQSSSK